jgi:hypothetical protein
MLFQNYQKPISEVKYLLDENTGIEIEKWKRLNLKLLL